MNRWAEVELGSVARIVRTTVDPANVDPQTGYLGLEHIERGGRIIGSATVESEGLLSSKFLFEAGDVLYGKLRPYLAKIAISETPGICSTDILPVRPGPSLNRRFLLHFLRQPALVEYANARTSGANLPRLTPTELAKFTLPLPPLPMQKRIAAVLDHVNGLRDQRRKVRSLCRELIRSLFIDMFGDARRNPFGWDTCLLGSVILDGPQNGLYRPGSDYGRGVPILRIDSFQGGSLKDHSKWKLVDADSSEIERYHLLSGDIVINRVNSRSHLGKSVMVCDVPEDAVFESNMMRLRVNPNRVLPFYVEQFLQTGYVRAQILGSAKDAVNQSSINQRDVKGLVLNVPPLSMQREFGERVGAVRTLQKANECHLGALDELFTSIQRRAFLGQLWDDGRS